LNAVIVLNIQSSTNEISLKINLYFPKNIDERVEAVLTAILGACISKTALVQKEF